jgi:hypothetical protein
VIRLHMAWSLSGVSTLCLCVTASASVKGPPGASAGRPRGIGGMRPTRPGPPR